MWVMAPTIDHPIAEFASLGLKILKGLQEFLRPNRKM